MTETDYGNKDDNYFSINYDGGHDYDGYDSVKQS